MCQLVENDKMAYFIFNFREILTNFKNKIIYTDFFIVSLHSF